MDILVAGFMWGVGLTLGVSAVILLLRTVIAGVETVQEWLS